ncbi:MAG: tetratricopeptide repeat protein [Bacillota bacterium]
MTEHLSRIYYNRGLELAREDYPKEAVLNLRKAISYDPDNISAWNLTGLCYYRMGKFKTAGYCWAHSVNRNRETNKATDYLVDLKAAFKETGPSFNRLYKLCADRKYHQAAKILNNEIIPHFDASEDLLNMLGILRLLEGKPRMAMDCWEKALTVNKKSTAALCYLNEVKQRPGYRFGLLKDKLINFKKE